MGNLKEVNKKKKTNNKRGAELVESILMIGVAIALIVLIFYPQIMYLMDTTLDSVEIWFTDALSKIGQPIT